MLFTGWEVRIEKYFVEAEGSFWDRDKIFLYPDRPIRYITFCFFFRDASCLFQRNGKA